MKILLIHQAFVGPNEAGGTRHYEFARHLIQQGHEFTIVASNLSYLTGQRTVEGNRLVQKEDIDGVRVLRAYTYPSLHKGFVWRIILFISFMLTSIWAGLRAGPVDLVMGTSPPIFQACSAWAVALLKRRPFLLEIRDLWPEFAIDMGVLKNPVLIHLSRWLESFLYARATHIVVNSPAYRTYLIEKGIAPEKVTLVANGVDTSAFSPLADGRAVRERYRLDGKFVVTYAGALGLANDIGTILGAAHRLRDKFGIHFLLIGDGKERDNLEAQAKSLHLTNVTFAGSHSKAEMPEFLAASNACVAILQNIPMFRTTYPNKVFDYMAAGRPTVLAIDGVIREVVETANGGVFVPPGNIEALANAILKLSQDREHAQAMGEAARAYVVENFDRQQQAVVFGSLVKQLIEKKGE